MFEDFNPEEATKKIVKFLQDTVHRAGFKKIIIPLSGGVDSSTVAFLAVQALGPANVLIARFPHKDLNKDNDGELVITKLKIPSKNIFRIEISEIVKSFLYAIPGIERPKFRESPLKRIFLGNLMARIRMILLYDLAKKHQALVCGTENKSEYLLGYFTRFGDEASDLEPIRNLYKTQVVRLASYLGVPEKIIKKKPSAGLWKGQTDEKELGFSYKDADQLLFLHFDKKTPWHQIVKMGFKKEVVEKVKTQIKRNWFKHKVPIVCR
ncbi:NAD+ synthase [Candidatus Gottesmanbacteria bacterium]|nr:NAD+ synthase [Candidatus Gottesmanbacteria bacterium]